MMEIQESDMLEAADLLRWTLVKEGRIQEETNNEARTQ